MSIVSRGFVFVALLEISMRVSVFVVHRCENLCGS